MEFDRHTKIKKSTFGKMGKKNRWKIKELKKIINKESMILDIGCAAGNIANYVINKNNFYGIDYSMDLVLYGRSKGLNITFCDLSEGHLFFDDEFFDVIWFSHVIEHLEVRMQVKIMKEIYRVLKPGGRVIVFAPSAYNPFFYDNDTHVRPMTHGSLEHLALDTGFKKANGKYSLIRKFPYCLQRWLRLTPLRWFLWEVYMVARK